MQKITWLFLVAALMCTGCESDPQAPAPRQTGVVGQVLRGPTQPICVVGDPCEEPFTATFHVYRDKVKVADFTTGPEGNFGLVLDPGEYVIVPDGSAPILFPEGQARVVTVPEGNVVTVRWIFDTGIV